MRFRVPHPPCTVHSPTPSVPNVNAPFFPSANVPKATYGRVRSFKAGSQVFLRGTAWDADVTGCLSIS
ncbi:hypothetical protein BD310DRAFT_942338 [Dichomitus squalens]|uniref:Uncharacterized protein n=1 Tax=Dichomitus squalens TaxID=114155 RepID=A0A4Q9P9M1_9APHY|nr:hypothetical protein BD310DRAFT_942338 [Dichomitus squalens]